MVKGVLNNKLDMGEESDADYELRDTNALFSSHANSIPLASSVHGPRVFYGSRQLEQALPLVEPEAAHVRNLENASGRSFDYVLGEAMGARRSKVHGTVHKITPDEIVIKTPEGKLEHTDLYNLFPGNRKSLQHNTPSVKAGDTVRPGDLLASSNFTDREGRMALGRNLRIGLAPYLGHSMDDAIVISQAAANKFTSDHAETVEQEADDSITRGLNHFVALFPKKFKEEQLKGIGEDGLVKPGTVLQPGDPVFLQTRPRSFSSASEGVSRLSRAQRFVRRDASKVWEGSEPATVLDAAHTRDGGVKVFVRYQAPAKPGDKLALRHGQKSIISRILPDDQMPRTEDGRPLEVLLNELSLPSRENAATFHELALGKIAEKTGKDYVLPSFLPKGQTWNKFVDDELEKNGVEELERVYDPVEHKFLDNPIKVGNAHVLRLHHLAEGKMSSRGQAGYDINMQPSKGGGFGGGAQRVSGLEMNVLHSSGATGVQKESILLRGQKNQNYWAALRANRTPPQLDKPFVWHKFLALLNGTGVHAREMGHGTLRLAPMTDAELTRRNSQAVQNDGIVDLSDFTPKPGGLFDPAMVRDKRWGHVDLPFPVVNPSYEATVRTLLGLTQKEYDAILQAPRENLLTPAAPSA